MSIAPIPTLLTDRGNSIPQNTGLAEQRKPSLVELKAEQAFRELARRRYREFRLYIWPGFVEAEHNIYTARKLQEVEKYVRSGGKDGIGRLIVCKPPQHGKSTDAARLFPAWVLGNNPDKRVIIASYAASLADKHSGAVRDYVQSERYKNLFGFSSTRDIPVDVSDTSGAKNDWDLAAPYRGGCVSAGIEGGLSGKGADLLIVDDPTKSAEEGRTELHQMKVRDWYESVAYQRMSQGGAIVIIQTRWNPDDLVGQLLKQMGSNEPGAEKWEVVFEPALALQEDEYPKTPEEFQENLLRGIYIPMGGDQLRREPGEALWPWKYSKEYIEKKKANTSSYIFASLDQQLPRAFSGGKFDEKDIMIIEPPTVPEKLNWWAYVDLALGQNIKSDFNAAYPFSMDPKNGDYLYRDLVRERELYKFLELLKKAMLDLKNRKVTWGIESTAFQTVIFNEFRKDPDLVTVRIRKVIPTESKPDRIEGLSIHSKEQPLKIVRQSSNKTVIRHLLDYPFGKNDDIEDTMAGGPYMMAKFGNVVETRIL